MLTVIGIQANLPVKITRFDLIRALFPVADFTLNCIFLIIGINQLQIGHRNRCISLFADIAQNIVSSFGRCLLRDIRTDIFPEIRIDVFNASAFGGQHFAVFHLNASVVGNIIAVDTDFRCVG